MNKKIEKFSIRIVEGCQITGFSISHMRYLIKENKVKSYLPSPKVRLIDYESLISYIQNNKEEEK